MAEALMFGPPIALGVIIGAYEALVIHRDVTVPTHRMGHTAHAFLLSIAFTFCTLNAGFVLNLIPALAGIPVLGTEVGLSIAIGLIAAIKIHGISRVTRTMVGTTAGLAETWFHSLLIGGLVAAAPFLYPIVEPMLPNWIKGW